MRLLPINQLQPGDITADTLRSADGRILLRAGVELTESMLRTLTRWNIPALPVEWPGFEDIDTTLVLSAPLIDDMVKWASQSGPLTWDVINQGQHILRKMWDEQLDAHGSAFELIPVYQVGTPFLSYYVNLVGLVMRLGYQLAPEWAEAYALAALLMGFHHKGLQDGQVREEDPHHALSLVKELRQFQVPSPTITTLLQHHARYDGSGVPNLKGEEIYRGAMILGLAENFLTLVFQTNEPALPAHEALEWVVGGAGMDFSLETVKKLQRIIAPYATGQVVSLGNHDVAVVRRVPSDWPSRPIIGLLNGKDAGLIIDLRDPDQQTRVITGIYPERLWP
ncbi:HD domain-containing protein [Sulfobacillus thermosulfidooxidans DSM 9293]|uniref:HD domain-containing protein n=2 Tax=Sulfobacillus thermosulfidooxidans TaxID=28034 RepID=A0A1W1WG91_SULTA|nr:HD domain-containing phosphohydrolase [Sulfobacillus thermosulfidooxidans]PSR26468.1 MAG: phosphohydrolase [Sulfobacillus thermosulfidooxidans]SMC05070.1 HD domain-containing protein [Sulfobacillus thermosulfidooxidans DSM 9293]